MWVVVCLSIFISILVAEVELHKSLETEHEKMQVFDAPGDKVASSTRTIRSTGTSSAWTPGSGWAGQKTSSSDRIIFPDSIEKGEMNLPPPPNQFITPCPNSQSFCDDDDNYPSDYIQKIPREFFDLYSNFFRNDTLTEVDNGLTARIGGNNEQTLCLSKEELVFPRKGQAIDKVTRLIVNTGSHLQGIRVELCMNEGSPCLFNESFPSGYATVCRQKYMARKMVVVSGSDPQTPLSISEFLLPSCCVCKTKQIPLHWP